jgi:hypothetical protein
MRATLPDTVKTTVMIMNPETLKVMKEAAEKARDAYPNVAWFTVADLQRTRVALSVVCSEHIARCDPQTILALIAEVERQAEENDQLRAANLTVLIQEITERLTPEEAATFRGLVLSATRDWVDEVTRQTKPTKRSRTTQ